VIDCTLLVPIYNFVTYAVIDNKNNVWDFPSREGIKEIRCATPRCTKKSIHTKNDRETGTCRMNKKIESEPPHSHDNPRIDDNDGQLLRTYLEEIRDKQDIQLRQNSWMLARLTKLEDKIDHTRIDAVIARRERCW
jgi:hypothetical protein